MSMHLVGPYLTTTGRKPGRSRFRTADQARAARQQQDSWQQLLTRHQGRPSSAPRSNRPANVAPVSRVIRRDEAQPRLPSVETPGGSAAMAAPKVYTGTKVKGIATMHKSNLVPVFESEHIKEIGRMRRG
jgi:hypothetical protein